MAELKTKPTKISPAAFIKSIADEQKRKDCRELLVMMKAITGKQPKMWGPSIIGFGQYHYQYNSGHEGDFFVTGFSPRKQALTIYIMLGFSKYQPLMKKLGKYKTGKSCLYVKKLDDIDRKVLHKLVDRSFKDMGKMYQCR